MGVAYFDLDQLIQQKQAARERDDRDLLEGRVSRDVMRRRNGLFSGVDLSQASVRIPRRAR